jgi:predicted O-methyltransferase YrrM
VKSDAEYEIGERDRAYIENLSPEPAAVLLAIEQAAEPERIPILDRESGRVLAVFAGDRRRIVEVGTAIGYSTLWMALAQPAGGRIVTIDPDQRRTDRARRFWQDAGVPDDRIHIVNRPALDAFAANDAALAGPFDLAFIDALKPEYRAYVEALLPRLAPGALVVADNVLWSGRASGAREADRSDESTNALKAFNGWLLRHPRFTATILPVGDGLLVARLRA